MLLRREFHHIIAPNQGRCAVAVILYLTLHSFFDNGDKPNIFANGGQ